MKVDSKNLTFYELTYQDANQLLEIANSIDVDGVVPSELPEIVKEWCKITSGGCPEKHLSLLYVLLPLKIYRSLTEYYKQQLIYNYVSG